MHAAVRIASFVVLCGTLLQACARGDDRVYVDQVTFDGRTGPVVVRALANAGVWIESDSTVVVVDALYAGTLSGETYHYANLDPADARAMRAGEGRWADVDLVLATHRHFDHFDAETVAAHMRSNPGADFAGPRQAAERLAAALGDSSRVHGFRPWDEGSGTLRQGSIEVRFLDLPHGGSWRGSIENVGLVVEIDGVRVLHVGDAATDFDLYEAVRDDVRDLDLFLVPVWFFADDAGSRVIREGVEARHVVGMHASPTRDRALERELVRQWAGVRLFAKLGG